MNTVLIADDDPSVRDLCRTILTCEGYRVLEAPDAPTCVAMASDQLPDLVLLDWMMPGVDGMDALRCLKRATNTRHIPVVMLTALSGISQINVATFNGADGYVTKPFEPADLITLVRRFTQTSVPPSEPEPAAGSAA